MREKLAFAALVAIALVMGGAARAQLRAGRDASAAARWTAADARALDEAVERLEERLLAHQAQVSFWSELQERHEQVSAVACANLGEHAVAIQDFEARFRARGGDPRRHRLASASE